MRASEGSHCSREALPRLIRAALHTPAQRVANSWAEAQTLPIPLQPKDTTFLTVAKAPEPTPFPSTILGKQTGRGGGGGRGVLFLSERNWPYLSILK